MKRAERRAASRRLSKAKVYTMRANGEALTLMADCILIRRDGKIVTLHWQVVDENGEPPFVRPTFASHQDSGGPGAWRVRWARRLLGIR